MKWVKYSVFVLFLVEVYWLMPDKSIAPRVSDLRALKGIFHVHSVFSDGGGTAEEIGHHASQAGIDFVVLTDHNDSTARKNGLERRYDNADLFVEMEASTPAGHALCFFSLTAVAPFSDSEVADRCYKHLLGEKPTEGMFLIAAHPSLVRNPWSQLDRYPEGMEVMNFDSVWQRLFTDHFVNFFITSALIPMNQYLATLRFFQFYQKDLVAWDGMNAFSPGHFGILAHDTHSNLKLNNRVAIRWPDYRETFRLASNIVFLDEPADSNFSRRKAQIYRAIRRGQLALAFDSVYPFTGNEIKLACAGREFGVGTTTAIRPVCQIVLKFPQALPFRKYVRLIRNGEVFREFRPQESSLSIPLTETGTYRVEVWVEPKSLLRILMSDPVPYVIYNPFYLTEG